MVLLVLKERKKELHLLRNWLLKQLFHRVRPALDLEVVEVEAGRAVVQSRTNYPAWILRGEVRLTEPA